jgi:acetyl-CoA acetyltransferase
MATKKAASTSNGSAGGSHRRERIAIVGGLRTPFARQGTAYRDMSALDLGKLVVRELLARAELDPAEVDLVVYGQALRLQIRRTSRARSSSERECRRTCRASV